MDSFTIWVLVYFILASAFFRLDKEGSFGLRTLYNLGRTEADINTNPDKGFVYGQNTKNKLAFAVIFDVVLTAIFWYFNALETGIKILLGFVGTPVVFFGFWFGGKLLIWFSKSFTSTIETIDDIETGKLDPKKKVTEAVESATNSVKEAVDDTVNTVKSSFSSKKDDEVVVTVKPTKVDTIDDIDEKKALEALERFSKGGK